MLLIEELPNTAATHRVSHGWAYVPDTGAPIAAVQPGTRKRGTAREHATSTSNQRNRIDASAKQQKAIQTRLEHLGRDNYRDNVDIPVPARTRNGKMTGNVRRILGYQSRFRQYLEGLEAELGQTGASTVTLPPVTGPNESTKKDGRSARRSLAMHAPPTPRPRTSSSVKHEDTEMPAPPSSSSQARPDPAVPYDKLLDNDPLLKTLNLPALPSARVMEALLSEPSLSYSAAAARPTENVRPARQFCVVCGYWGKVRCRKCEGRMCGDLDCWKGHQCVLY